MKTILSTISLMLIASIASADYVYDSSGGLVRDSYGNCVRADLGGTPPIEDQIACGDVTVTEVEREVVITTEGGAAAVDSYDSVVNFAFDSYRLDDEALVRLALFVETQVPEGAVVVVFGHTDAVGTEDYNDALGLNRASVVADELARLGVTVLDVVSRGETELLVDTQEANRTNRRVQVDVVIE